MFALNDHELVAVRRDVVPGCDCAAQIRVAKQRISAYDAQRIKCNLRGDEVRHTSIEDLIAARRPDWLGPSAAGDLQPWRADAGALDEDLARAAHVALESDEAPIAREAQ